MCMCLCVRVSIPAKTIRHYDCTMGFMDLSNDFSYLFSSWNKQQICASLYKFKGVKRSQGESMGVNSRGIKWNQGESGEIKGNQG